MTDYCSILLNPSTKSDILAACIQAAAASAAGHEQAKATGLAGLASIVTGVLALGGGRYAYLAAVRQVKLIEEEAATRRRLFLQFLDVLISDTIAEIMMYLELYQGTPGLLAQQVKVHGLLPETSSLIEVLSPKNWQNLVNAGDVRLRPYVFLHLAESLRSSWKTVISDIGGIKQPTLPLIFSASFLEMTTSNVLEELRKLKSTIVVS